MMLLFMLQMIIITSVVALAALAADRALRLLRLPTRGIWAIALVSTATLSVLTSPTRGNPAAPRSLNDAVAVSGVTVPVDVRTIAASGLQTSTATPRTWALRVPAAFATKSVDRALDILWIAGTMALLAAVGAMMWRIRQRVRAARAERVQGMSVRVAELMGPATVGVLRPTVVIPQWVLSLDEQRQRMVLLHEREHARVYDPALLLITTLCAVAAPWNIAIWWMLSQLQAATEIDCDLRVLRANTQLRSYIALLLDVGSGQVGGFAPALGRGRNSSMVRRRITTMLRRTPKHPRIIAGALLGASAAGLVAACHTPAVRAAEATTAANPIAASGSEHAAVAASASVAQTRPTTAAGSATATTPRSATASTPTVASVAATGASASSATASTISSTRTAETAVTASAMPSTHITSVAPAKGARAETAITATSSGATAGSASATSSRGLTATATSNGGERVTAADVATTSAIAGSAAPARATTVSSAMQPDNDRWAPLLRRYYPELLSNGDPSTPVVVGFVLNSADSVVATRKMPLPTERPLDMTRTLKALFPDRTPGTTGGMGTWTFMTAGRPSHVVIAWTIVDR